jgi:hypothetical protein
MPLMRRRPLMRAAMVGGGAYVAGKHVANKQQHEAEQDAELAQMQQPTDAVAAAPAAPVAAAPAAAAPAAMSEADRIDALTKLKGLLDSGVLTEEQFEAEKAKLLG